MFVGVQGVVTYKILVRLPLLRNQHKAAQQILGARTVSRGATITAPAKQIKHTAVTEVAAQPGHS